MSFQVHVGLLGLSAEEASAEASASVGERALYSTYDPDYVLQRSPTVAISDSEGDTLANGLLSDDADWNASYWQIRPASARALADVAEKWFLTSPGGVAFFAGWIGDEPISRKTVSLEELSGLIRGGRLPTKTLLVAERTHEPSEFNWRLE